jgi:PhzF family phenazine biosynthesis protein
VPRPFRQVDVFTATPYLGNPVAVVHDADGLTTEQMQRIARWTNLSETTFVLRPAASIADYRVRIFTPDRELPFAGHPTLGTAHAWLEAGGRPATDGEVAQECGVGLVRVRRDGDRLSFVAPPLRRSGPLDAELRARVVEVLGLDPGAVVDAAWVDNGPGWIGVLLADAEAVLAVSPRPSDLCVGVVGPHPPGADHALEVRAFFPVGDTTVEDPVTGSLNASLAQWLLGTERLDAPYVARQGTARGRSGEVHVDRDADGTIWVGGRTVTCVRGTIEA